MITFKKEEENEGDGKEEEGCLLSSFTHNERASRTRKKGKGKLFIFSNFSCHAFRIITYFALSPPISLSLSFLVFLKTNLLCQKVFSTINFNAGWLAVVVASVAAACCLSEKSE